MIKYRVGNVISWDVEIPDEERPWKPSKWKTVQGVIVKVGEMRFSDEPFYEVYVGESDKRLMEFVNQRNRTIKLVAIRAKPVVTLEAGNKIECPFYNDSGQVIMVEGMITEVLWDDYEVLIEFAGEPLDIIVSKSHPNIRLIAIG